MQSPGVMGCTPGMLMGKNMLRDPRNDESFPEVVKIMVSSVVSPEESTRSLTAMHKPLLCLAEKRMC